MGDSLVVKLLSRDEAIKHVPIWPADVSFSETFARLQSQRYGLETGYLIVACGGNELFFPVQWGKGSAFSVYKGHTMPCLAESDFMNFGWRDIATKVQKLTNSDLYIADLVIPMTMSEDLKPLPSAVFIIDTSQHDIDFVFSTFNKTTRNLIRRSREQGFKIEVISGIMPERYYDLFVYHQKSMGTPPRPKEYFDEVARVFGKGFLLIGAYHNNRLVGMNLAWCADRGLWLSINSSVAEYGPKHVNYLLYYETIRWACEHDIDRIDLGGSSTREGNIHNTFKLGFGATMSPLYRLRTGTFTARMRDILSRKKWSLRIRLNKFIKLFKKFPEQL
jgi:hypothetical protein